jgi:hypothetical protein
MLIQQKKKKGKTNIFSLFFSFSRYFLIPEHIKSSIHDEVFNYTSFSFLFFSYHYSFFDDTISNKKIFHMFDYKMTKIENILINYEYHVSGRK